MSWQRGRIGSGLVSAVFVGLFALGCSMEETPTGVDVTAVASYTSGCSASEAHGPGWVSGGSSGNGEGEVFGSIYVDGERYCDDPMWIRLAPVSTLTLPGVFQDSLMISHTWPLMWEFWDTLADGPCGTDPVSSERAHYYPTTGDERHCVRPGKFTFTGPGRSGTRSFDVDYLEGYGSVIDSTPGTTHTSASVVRNTPIGSGAYADLTINIDLGESSYSDTPVLDIDTSSVPATGRFKNIASPVGTGAVSWRFSVGRSTVSWNSSDGPMNGRGRALARLYKYTGSSWEPLTAYYDYYSEYSNLIRVFKDEFPAPTCPTTTITYTVGLELMRPDENPAGSPTTTRTFDVIASCASPYLATVDVTPAVDTVAVASTINLTANGYDQYSSWYSTSFSWTSRATGVATVDGSTGVVTGVSSGGAWIVASSGGLADSAYVVVQSVSPYLASVAVTPSTASVNVSSTTNLTATGYDQFAAVFSTSFSWLSRSTGVATVNSSGVVTGVSPGTSWIVASSGGFSDSALVTVEGVEVEITSFTFSCYDHDANGHSYNVISGSWTITGSAGGATWQVKETASSTPPSWGSPNSTGSSGLSGAFGWYRNDVTGPDYRYFWVKYESNGSWFPLGGSVQAIDVSDPNLCDA